MNQGNDIENDERIAILLAKQEEEASMQVWLHRNQNSLPEYIENEIKVNKFQFETKKKTVRPLDPYQNFPEMHLSESAIFDMIIQDQIIDSQQKELKQEKRQSFESQNNKFGEETKNKAELNRKVKPASWNDQLKSSKSKSSFKDSPKNNPTNVIESSKIVNHDQRVNKKHRLTPHSANERLHRVDHEPKLISQVHDHSDFIVPSRSNNHRNNHAHRNHFNSDFSTDDNYEELLKLDEDLYDRGNGFDITKLSLLPIYKFKSTNQKEEPCSICLNQFKTGEDVCRLPCLHLFHDDCIKEWLQRKKKCSVCNEEVNFS